MIKVLRLGNNINLAFLEIAIQKYSYLLDKNSWNKMYIIFKFLSLVNNANAYDKLTSREQDSETLIPDLKIVKDLFSVFI